MKNGLRLGIAVSALLALSASGFWGVDREWRYAATFGETFSTFMQTLYALLGIWAALGLWRRWRLSRGVLYCWAFALVLTGATAPAAWGNLGWKTALLSTFLTGAIAAAVIWLAALPPAPSGWHRRPLLFGLFSVAAVGALAFAVQYGTLALEGGSMEQFCEGLRFGLTEQELAALADRQGYVARPGNDAKGHYLRLEDAASAGRLRCEARFKPDGTLAAMTFTAHADD